MEERLKNYKWLGNVLVIAICAWLAAGLVGAIVSAFWGKWTIPQASRNRAASQPSTLLEVPGGKEAILNRNLFGKNIKENTGDEGDVPYQSGTPAVATGLKITLLGTVVTPDASKSIATIQ